MAHQKFTKYLERKDPELVRKPKVIDAGKKLTGADDLAGEPNKPPKEACPMKDGKQSQVKESLWGRFLEKKQVGSVVERPATEIVADYPFKPPAAPPEAKTKGKNWDAKAPKASKPLPYKSGTDAGPKPTPSEGLGNLGSIPKEEIKLTAGDSQYIPGGKTVGDYTTKTESFLKKTKDMPLQEFAKYIIKESGDVHSELPLALQYISSISENDNVVRDLVVAFKQQNRINQLVTALFEYPEAYTALGNLLGDGQKGLSRCNSLVRAMNEIVGPPLGMGDMEDEPETRRIGDDEMGDEEDPDAEMDDEMGDEEEDPDDEDLDDMDDDDMEDDDEDMDDDELGDEEDLDGLGGEEDMGSPEKGIMGSPLIKGFLARKELMKPRGRLGMENLIQAIKKQNG